MNRILSLFLSIICFGCVVNENRELVNVQRFYDQITRLSSATIVDVRTPNEFHQGHLINAINVDWNDENFEQQVAVLDKEKPVFIYCLSGGRSSRAAKKMLELNFKNVIELKGGIIEWRKNEFPEVKETSNSYKSISISEFNNSLISEKLVVVSYYAKWCAPCKVMKPFLEEISQKMSDKVTLVSIDYDQNLPLMKTLGIEGLPTTQFYAKSELLDSKIGFISKKQIEEFIEKLIPTNYQSTSP